MSAAQGHKYSASSSQNVKAQLANAYNELGKELSSSKVRVVGNYTLGKVIGEGTYGKVRLGTHRLTSTRVAIKQIPKAMSAALTREIHHHRRLHHPHVTQLYEVIATESNIWLVTELCSGGELFDYLAEKGRLSEDETRSIFGQLCLAVGYIHEKGVVHRDLKLENVLLDERCRVKLGDFGFTREFERGALLDTYCGTTGYAAPEMLMAKKYLGPEVDIWSLGIIFYCLLTGTLPFDDDDESVMREKIILGSYDIPDWLSPDARDLIRSILQHDPTKRPSISHILAHPWFKHAATSNAPPSTPLVASPTPLTPSSPDVTNPNQIQIPTISQTQSLTSPSNSESSFQTASSELPPRSASGQDLKEENERTIRGKPSEDTVKREKDESDIQHGPSAWRRSSKQQNMTTEPSKNGAEIEREQPFPSSSKYQSRDPSPSAHPSGQPTPPTTYPARTPARTKRRSVSSILSVPPSPTAAEGQMPHSLPPQDYASLLSTPAPLLFSTSLERSLLNNLSDVGFDIGQMVHSVLSDACDSAGAMWWMLKRKAEKKALEATLKRSAPTASKATDVDTEAETEIENIIPATSPLPSPAIHNTSVDPMSKVGGIDQSQSAPQLSFVPATPTVPERNNGRKSVSPPATPPRSKSPRSLLSPTPTSTESQTQTQTKSSPSTPSGSVRDKDSGSNSGSKGKGSKPRSGSVSIMQRATTALEAAGLVRKKSAEAVREDKEKKEREKEDKEDKGKRPSTSTDSKTVHSNGSAKLTKSPPMRPVRDQVLPSTPEHDEIQPSSLSSASPWVVPVTRANTFSIAPTPANSPGDVSPFANGDPSQKVNGGARNRTSILSTFRTWFNEDRKGKRKAVPPPPVSPPTQVPAPTSPSLHRTRSASKRRGGMGGFGVQRPRAKRASVSSRRSSSVNSRRSSVASMQMVVMETSHAMENITRQRSDPSRRSFTPNSEFDRSGDYPSRPSSVRSYSMQQTRHGHKKSPSASSIGSTPRLNRAASPLQKYHRRAGSGSSTRVVRQTRPSPVLAPRPTHGRSNSTTSSIHSLHSSRPGSFYDASEGEGQRTGSPLPHNRSRRSLDETPRRGAYSTVLVAHKRQTPFTGPSGSGFSPSVSRLSWKKAWGTEPPGWKSRPTQYPVEVLAILPSADQPTSIRDVFSNRQSLSLGDDSDWVDEDDESPAFAGGLGQNSTFATSSKQTYEAPMMLSPPPRVNGRNAKKQPTRNSGSLTPRTAAARAGAGSRVKPGHSPIIGNAPLPGGDGLFDSPPEVVEPRVSRRQLPPGRSGPAFKQAIQEEDEDEE